MKKALLGTVGLALLGMAGASNATLITSSADPALAGSTIINFDSTASGDAASFTFGDVTFATTSGLLAIAPYTDGGVYGTTGQELSTRDTTGTSSFSISFATPVSAFGMVWGASNPDWTVNLFDSSNALLETLTFIGGTGSGGGSFIEYYGAANSSGIARADLQSNSGYDWVKIDDFRYVTGGGSVPEPASIALMGLGLIGIGAMRRRKLG